MYSAELKKNYEVMMNLDTNLENRPDFVVFLDKDILTRKFPEKRRNSCFQRS